MISVNNEIVVFKDNEIELNVNLSTEENTVWLNANQMALLFDKDEKLLESISITFLKIMNLMKITTRKKCVLLA